ARCEAAPQLLWSRTISTSQASFGGAADRAGNVYWTETDPPPSWTDRIFDSAGVELWTVRLSDTRYYGSQLLAWPDVPWLTALGVQRISPGNGYVAAPEAWDELVLSGNSGFAIRTVSHALTIEQIQRGAVV